MDDQADETCHIRRVIKSGAFSASVFYVAEKPTITGNIVLARSSKVASRFNGFVWNPPPQKLFGEIAAELHQQVLSQLIAEGWEPMDKDKDGKVIVLKRRGESKVKAQKTEPGELLQQLASLREAGLLTEEEYEEKKAEIIRRW